MTLQPSDPEYRKHPNSCNFFFLYQTHASVSIEILCQPLSEPVFSQAFCFVQFYQIFFLHFSHAFFPSPVFLQLIRCGPWRRLGAKLMRQIGSFSVCFVVIVAFFSPRSNLKSFIKWEADWKGMLGGCKSPLPSALTQPACLTDLTLWILELWPQLRVFLNSGLSQRQASAAVQIPSCLQSQQHPENSYMFPSLTVSMRYRLGHI